jgi:hypothetical protein
MAKGDRADLLRALRIGRLLRPHGWHLRGLTLRSDSTLEVAGIPCRRIRFLYVGFQGCNLSDSLERKGPSRSALARTLRELAGPGPTVPAWDSKWLQHRRGIRSPLDVERVPRRYRAPGRALPIPKREALCLRLLDRFGPGASRSWEVESVDFAFYRRYSAGVRKWSLNSSLFFAAREALYWNSVLYADGSKTQSEAAALARPLTTELRGDGLRVAKPWISKAKGGTWDLQIPFDRHSLSSPELLRRLKRLAAWRPTSAAARPSP